MWLYGVATISRLLKELTNRLRSLLIVATPSYMSHDVHTCDSFVYLQCTHVPHSYVWYICMLRFRVVYMYVYVHIRHQEIGHVYMCTCAHVWGMYTCVHLYSVHMYTDNSALLQKRPMKETIFCKRDLWFEGAIKRDHPIWTPHYEVTMNRLLQIIGLFCRISFLQ